MPLTDEQKNAIRGLQKIRGSLGPAQQARVDELSRQLDTEEKSVSAAPPKSEGLLERAKTDVNLGYRTGVAHLEQTVGNAASRIPIKAVQEVGRQSAAAAARTAPTAAELAGHTDIFDQVAQGAGQLLPALVENAPAIALKGKAEKYAPVAAGVIGAVGALDKGPAEAVKEGARAAAGWYLQGKAAKLERPLTRIAASSAAMAVPAAIESGGDTRKTIAAGILGGALGLPAHKELSPETARKALRGGADAVEALKSDIHSTLNPQAMKTLELTEPASAEFPTGRKVRTADDRAAISKEVLITRGAERVRRNQMARYALNQARDVVGKLTQAEQYGPGGLSDAIETRSSPRPVPFATPELRTIATTVSKAVDDAAAQAERITQIVPGDPKTGKAFRFYVDYLSRIYKDPAKAAAYMESVGRPVEDFPDRNSPAGTQRRPLAGGSQRFKPRSREETINEETGEKISGDLIFKTISDAIRAGIEPAHANLVDMQLAAIYELHRFTMAQEIIRDLAPERPDLNLAGAGVLKLMPHFQSAPPAGYEEIRDPSFRAYGLDKKTGERQYIGKWVAPTSVAQTFNNYLSPGLNKFAAYRNLLSMGNVLNYTQLGISFFHGGMTAMQAVTSDVSLGIMKSLEGIRTGKPELTGRGVRDIVGAPLAPFRDPFRAYDIRRELREPGSTGNVETQHMAERFVQAGGRDGIDPVYQTHIVEKMQDAWKEGKTLAAVLRVPGAILEKTAQPLMEHYVPLQKIAAFSKMAEFELQRLGDEPTERQKTQAFQKAYQSVENRFGQLAYDNLMWNRIAKDLGMLTIRSVGWKLGTFREIGGGAADWARFVRDVPSDRRADFTHRMAYTVAMPLVVGTIGAMTNYLLVNLFDPEGVKKDPNLAYPQSWKDYLAPRTGLKDQYGHDERIWFPSYMKDVYHFVAEGPSKYLQSSEHPMISTIFDMWNNKDFYGVEIRNPNDPWFLNAKDPLMTQLTEMMGYTAEQFLPLSIRNETRQGGEDFPAALKMANYVGITAAPASIKRSATENYAAQLLLSQGGGVALRKQAEADRREINKQVRAAMKTGTDPRPFIQQGLRDGVISPADIKTDTKQFRFSSLYMDVTRLSFANTMRVYLKAGPEERAEIKPVIAMHARNWANEDRAGKKNSVEEQEIRDLWQKIQESERAQ